MLEVTYLKPTFRWSLRASVVWLRGFCPARLRRWMSYSLARRGEAGCCEERQSVHFRPGRSVMGPTELAVGKAWVWS